MDVWHLILYAAASILALRSLVSLMTHHKAHYRQRLLTDQQMHRKSNRSRKKAEQQSVEAEAASEPAA